MIVGDGSRRVPVAFCVALLLASSVAWAQADTSKSEESLSPLFEKAAYRAYVAINSVPRGFGYTRHSAAVVSEFEGTEARAKSAVDAAAATISSKADRKLFKVICRELELRFVMHSESADTDTKFFEQAFNAQIRCRSEAAVAFDEANAKQKELAAEHKCLPATEALTEQMKRDASSISEGKR
jgi:hypothetical protein